MYTALSPVHEEEVSREFMTSHEMTKTNKTNRQMISFPMKDTMDCSRALGTMSLDLNDHRSAKDCLIEG